MPSSFYYFKQIWLNQWWHYAYVKIPDWKLLVHRPFFEAKLGIALFNCYFCNFPGHCENNGRAIHAFDVGLWPYTYTCSIGIVMYIIYVTEFRKIMHPYGHIKYLALKSSSKILFCVHLWFQYSKNALNYKEKCKIFKMCFEMSERLWSTLKF